MKRTITAIIVILTSINAFAQFDIWLAKGQQAMYNKNYEQAIDAFNEAIKINDKNANAYYNRGLAYLFSQVFEKAYYDFSRAIELDTTLADAYNNRGYCLFINGNFADASLDFDKAIQLDPKFEEAYINRGSNNIDLGKTDAAISDLKKAISFNDKNPSPYMELGRAYYKMKNYKLSAENYSLAIKYGLNNPKMYYSRGNAYFKLEDYKKAISDYTIAFKSDSTDIDALNNRAMAYDNLGDQKAADADRTLLQMISGTDKIFIPFEKLVFKNVTDSAKKFSFVMPESWNIIEYHSVFSDDIIISPEKIDKITSPFSIGVKLSFNKNMKEYYKVSDPDSLIEFWYGSVMANAKDYFSHQVLYAKQIAKSVKGRQNLVVVKYTQDSYPLTMYEYALADENVLFYSFHQAPEKQFEFFKPVFDKIIESIKLIHKE
jgi:tetratricopeptide (TPR) repeat protein